MSRLGAVLSLTVFGAIIGCGDVSVSDPAGGPSDAGPGASFEFDLACYERTEEIAGERGAPLAGVHVAVDLPTGERLAVTTGASGKARITVPDGVDEVTVTAARTGYLPITTFYRVTKTEVAAHVAEVGELYAVFSPQEWPVPVETVSLTFESESDAAFCVDVGLGVVSCTSSGSLEIGGVRAGSAAAPYVAYSLDGDGCAARLIEGALPDTLTDLPVDLDFDSPTSTTPERVEVTLLMPNDPESEFRQKRLLARDAHPLWAKDFDQRAAPLVTWDHEGLIRGGACAESVSADVTSMDLSVVWFGAPEGHVLSFETIAFVYDVTGDGWDNPCGWASLADQPLVAGSYQLIDEPRVDMAPLPANLSSVATFQPVEGARVYDLLVQDDTPVAGPAIWMVRSFRHQPLSFPALPEGYDRGADWMEAGAGDFRVSACDRFIPWPWPGFATGSGLPARCGYSDPYVGTLSR